MKWRDIWGMVKEVIDNWSADKAPRMGAALAYYSIFSLAPIVVIAISIAGIVFEEKAAHGGIVREIEGTVGEPAAAAIEELVKNAGKSGGGHFAAALSLVLLLFGASGVFVELQDSLNTIWKVPPREGSGVWNWIRDRFLSFAAVFGTGFLLLVSLIVSAALSAMSKYFTPASMPGGPALWMAANTLVSLVFIALLFALIFKWLPDVKIDWRDVWTGAALTAILFTIGKYLIGLYLGRSSTTSAYGAAGSLVVILVWVYYSTQIMLFGAEFTRVYALRCGSRKDSADHRTYTKHEAASPSSSTETEASQRFSSAYS